MSGVPYAGASLEEKLVTETVHDRAGERGVQGYQRIEGRLLGAEPDVAVEFDCRAGAIKQRGTLNKDRSSERSIPVNGLKGNVVYPLRVDFSIEFKL